MFLKKLSQLFPLPSYVRMPAVGIDISDFSVKFIELISHGDHFSVGRFGSVQVPTEAVKNGTIIDRGQLIAALKKLKKDNHLQFVRASLPEEKAYLFTTTVPNVSRQEIRSALQFKIEENVPLSPNEAVFDYDVARARDTLHQERQEVVVSVYPANLVQSYEELLVEAGLTPLSFEIEGQSIARAVVHRNDPGTYMIVDFGRTRSGVAIVSGGVVRFTTTVDVGGDGLTEAIKRTFPNLSQDEIEEMKNKKGLLESKEGQTPFETLMNTTAALRDEINRHLIYWHTHPDAPDETRESVQKIILCGGNANLAGLPEYLETSLKIPTVRADVWTNVLSLEQVIPPISFTQSLGYASAIGLALHQDESHG